MEVGFGKLCGGSSSEVIKWRILWGAHRPATSRLLQVHTQTHPGLLLMILIILMKKIIFTYFPIIKYRFDIIKHVTESEYARERERERERFVMIE